MSKKIRVNASLDQDVHDKLRKIAISCDMTKTKLAAELLKMCVNHSEIVNWIQDKHNIDKRYRVVPIKTTKGLEY